MPVSLPKGMPKLFCQDLAIQNTACPSLWAAAQLDPRDSDHCFAAFKVPSEIKAGSQFMTPDATYKVSQDTKKTIYKKKGLSYNKTNLKVKLNQQTTELL